MITFWGVGIQPSTKVLKKKNKLCPSHDQILDMRPSVYPKKWDILV